MWLRRFVYILLFTLVSSNVRKDIQNGTLDSDNDHSEIDTKNLTESYIAIKKAEEFNTDNATLSSSSDSFDNSMKVNSEDKDLEWSRANEYEDNDLKNDDRSPNFAQFNKNRATIESGILSKKGKHPRPIIKWANPASALLKKGGTIASDNDIGILKETDVSMLTGKSGLSTKNTNGKFKADHSFADESIGLSPSEKSLTAEFRSDKKQWLPSSNELWNSPYTGVWPGYSSNFNIQPVLLVPTIQQTAAAAPQSPPVPVQTEIATTKAPSFKTKTSMEEDLDNNENLLIDEPKIVVNTNMSVMDQIMLINIDPELDFPATISTDDGELFELFEGDIFRTKKLEQEVADMKSKRYPQRLELAMKSGKWPDGVIPYSYHEKFSDAGRKIISSAIKALENVTCLTFRQRTEVDDDYVEFLHGGGCASMVGRQGGRQQISLSSSCLLVGIALHQFMHAIGFFHEQNRRDRDKFIQITWNNIKKEMWYNFQRYREPDPTEGSYDAFSIMEFGNYAFTVNGQQTIVLKSDPKQLLGQRLGLGKVDIERINKLYNCTKSDISGLDQRDISKTRIKKNRKTSMHFVLN